jgi:membrane protease YdiL (CAAX protease family)
MNEAVPVAPRELPPVVLARWVDDLDRATGWAAAAPLGKLILLAVVPAMAVGWAVPQVQSGPESPVFTIPPLFAAALFLVFQPAVAAVLMRFILWLTHRYIHEPLGLVIVGAFLWGTANAHSPAWGAQVVWPFYVMAAAFLRLQERSLSRAYSVVILVHALFNLVTCAPDLWRLFAG